MLPSYYDWYSVGWNANIPVSIESLCEYAKKMRFKYNIFRTRAKWIALDFSDFYSIFYCICIVNKCVKHEGKNRVIITNERNFWNELVGLIIWAILVDARISLTLVSHSLATQTEELLLNAYSMACSMVWFRVWMIEFISFLVDYICGANAFAVQLRQYWQQLHLSSCSDL